MRRSWWHAALLLGALASAAPLSVNGTRLPQRQAKPVAGGAVVPAAGTLPLTWRGMPAGRLCSDSNAFAEALRVVGGAKVTDFYTNYGGLTEPSRLWLVPGKGCADKPLAEFRAIPEGSVLWQSAYAARSPENRPPVVGPDGTVYVQAGKNELHALTPVGKLKWRFTLPEGKWSEWSSALSLGPDGTLYAGLYNGDLIAFSPAGQEKWRFRTAALVVRPPAFGPGGTVYLGAVDHKLYALTPAGQKKWAYRAGSTIYSPTRLGPDGTLYFAADDGLTYAVSGQGNLRWKVKLPGLRPVVRAVTKGGTVLVTSFASAPGHSAEAVLHAVSPAGKVLWVWHGPPIQSVWPAPDGTLYVENLGQVAALGHMGKVLWTFRTGQNYSPYPTLLRGSDGTLYFAASNRIYALNADGTVKWLRDFPGEAVYPTLNASGDLIVTAWNGRTYALATTSRGPA